MDARFVNSLFGAADLDQVHRRVVQVGAAAAWIATSLVMLAGLVTGETSVYFEAAGPAAAAGLMTAQTLLHKEQSSVAMFGSAIILTVSHAVIGGGGASMSLSLALVVLCSIGVFLMERGGVLPIAVTFVALLISPQLWRLDLVRATGLGVTMGAAFLVSSVIFIAVRNTAARFSARFRTLFEESPAAVLEEDWTEAVDYVRSEYSGRPDRIEAFLMAYPSVIRRAVGKAKVIRANRACVDLLEAESEEALVGYRDGNRVTEVNLDAWAAALGALYRGDTTFGIDMATVTRKGRPIWLQVKGADTSSERPASSVLIGLADVTHSRARSEAMAELVRAKNDFIAKVSHELRTPLTAVVGLAAELASGDDMDPADREEITRLVASQADEVANIVEDLLVASRAELGSMSVETVRVDLGRELEATVDGLNLQVKEMPESVPLAVGDPVRIRQILRNLLTNAGRYGGTEIRVLAGTLGARVWIEVRDDGPGAPASLADRIFDPYTGAGLRSGESVGIGLSVSQQLAELMRGSLTYRRDGDETVFRLQLPAHSAGRRPILASQTLNA